MHEEWEPRPENAPLLAGVELGGTKCVCLLGTGPDDVRDLVTVPTAEPDATLDGILGVLARWDGIAALGIASFGPLDLDPRSTGYGRIVNTPKPGWSDVDLTRLTNGVAARIDTDVTGAALAEGLWGAARGLDSWCYITVGTGVGVGIIVDGAPVRGLGHAEAGHMRVPVPSHGWGGACPFHGACVEGVASGFAIEARTGVPAAALAHDDPAWDDVVEALAVLCHNLVLTACPQRIMIGGGVAMGQPHLLPRLRKALQTSLAGYATTGGLDIATYVVAPLLGERAGPLGALALAGAALRG